MTIETVVNKVTDGAITSITLRIHKGNKLLQEATVELPLYEERAIIKSNRFFIDDERLIADCFALLKKELGNHGVQEILIPDTDGNLLTLSS